MPKTKQPQFYIARETFWVHGIDHPIIAGETRVQAGHALLKSHPGAFEPVAATRHFDVEQATAAPGERRAVVLTTQGENNGEEV